MAAPGAELGNLSAAMENPEAASPASVIALQQRYGNRAVRRLLQREGNAPTTTAPTTSRFDLETPRGLWKHLSLLYHPDKANSPEEIPWRSQLMTKINGARNDLAALKRLAAEGEAHTTGATTSPSTELAPLPDDGGGSLAPISTELVQNAAPLAIEMSSSTNSEAPSEDTSQPKTGPAAEEDEDARPDRPVFEAAHLRMQTLGHNRKVLPVLKKYMAGQNASSNYNFYFDASQNTKELYRKYIADGAPQQVQLPPALKQQLDGLAQSQDWTRMASLMDRARAANQEFINTNIMPVFELASEYQQFKETSRDRPVLARVAKAVQGAVRPRAAGQRASTGRTVAVLDQAIDRYTRVFNNGRVMIRDLDRKISLNDWVPTLVDKEAPTAKRAKLAVRLFEQGKIRHANIVAAFTRLYAADKTFRKDRYGAFYSRLSAFTKLWLDYKTLLQR